MEVTHTYPPEQIAGLSPSAMMRTNEARPVFPGARGRLRAFRNVWDEIRARIEGDLAKPEV